MATTPVTRMTETTVTGMTTPTAIPVRDKSRWDDYT
jgi:hypothetical protein